MRFLDSRKGFKNMKQYVGTILSVMVAGAYAAQEPKNPEKSNYPEKRVNKWIEQECCVELEIFEKLVRKLDAQHAQEREVLKANLEKEFRECTSSRAHDLTNQEAQHIVKVFKKKRLKEEEKLRVKQTQERREKIRKFVDIYYPDNDKECHV